MRNVVGALMKHGWAGLALAVAALLLALTAQPAAGAIPKVCRSSAVCKGACRQACNSLSVAKLAQLVVKYPAGWTDARLAAELFTPAATLAVTPIGAFEGALTALEYITTFSRASPVPAIANLTGLKLVHAMVTDQTATVYFDLMLANPLDATRAAPLRGIVTAAFDPASSRVSSMVMDYPQYGDTSLKLSSPGGSTAQEEAFLVGPLCAAHAAYCTGPNAQWPSIAACTASLRATPVRPPAWRLAGNNLYCRLFHARFISVDPGTHCPHVGPSGGGKCTDDPLSYAYANVDALIPPGTFAGADKLLLPSLKRIVANGASGDLFNGGIGDIIGNLLGGRGFGGVGAGSKDAAPHQEVDLWPETSPADAGSRTDGVETLLEALVERERVATAQECDAATSAADGGV